MQVIIPTNKKPNLKKSFGNFLSLDFNAEVGIFNFNSANKIG
jgi:hypothetical protein